jgi:hypothetical protein
MVRLNITLPEEIYEKLATIAGERRKSRYISMVLKEKLQKEEEKSLENLLREGYLCTKNEDSKVNEEWEEITIENWEN